MTQLAMTSSEATVVERQGVPAGRANPDLKKERAREVSGGRAPAPRKRPHDPLRDRLEALYSKRFPAAHRVVANTAYENGPLVEVHREGGIDLYRPTLDEQGGGA